MTSTFVLGGSSPLSLLEDELVADGVDNAEIEDCILDKGFEFDAGVEGVGLSS